MTQANITETHKRGRPVEFTATAREQLLDLLMSGKSNGEACDAVGISRDTLHRTISKDAEFRDLYQQAKALSVDALIDEGDRLAELALRAETGAQAAGIKIALDHTWRKASRLAPTRWGERPSVAVVVNEINDPGEVARRLAFLEALRSSLDEE